MKNKQENLEEFGEEKEEEYGPMNMVLEAKENEPLDEGTYECEYVGTVEKTNTQDGGKYLSHKWKVLEVENKHVRENSSFAFSPKSKLWDIFKGCGIKLEVGKTANLQELAGKKCLLYIVQEKTDNGTFNKVKSHVPVKKSTEGEDPPSP